MGDRAIQWQDLGFIAKFGNYHPRILIQSQAISFPPLLFLFPLNILL